LRAGRAALLVGLVLFVLGAGAAGAALSCLPDLPGNEDSGPPLPLAKPGCGDGIIDLEAGEECDPGGAITDGGVCSLNCKVICAGLKWPENDHCYELQEATASFTQAEQTCDLLYGSHVATFASDDELGATVLYARENALGASDFWVGIHDSNFRYSSVVSDEPGWSPQCSGCYAHTADPRLALRLPRGVEAGAGCVVQTFLGGDAAIPPWEQHPCEGVPAYHVLCEREPVGVHSRALDAGVVGIDLVYTFGEKYYVFVAQGLPAGDAEAYCASLGDGGTLVVFESRDEREQLWHELAQLQPPPSQVWVGLATDDGGFWTWDDGARTDAAYPPEWGVNEPVAEAGRAFMQADPYLYAIDNTLGVSAQDPTEPMPFVCQIPQTTK
jgi:hypothetical protein